VPLFFLEFISNFLVAEAPILSGVDILVAASVLQRGVLSPQHLPTLAK